jgi:Cu-Zn family superoxide dismutase
MARVDLVSSESKITAHAIAEISGRGISGTAKFTEYDVDGYKYVKVSVKIKGEVEILTPGKHACHIHERAITCQQEGEDAFMCTGGHFDPGPNGNSNPDVNHSYHAGDLPNIIVDEHGNGQMEAITNRFSLTEGPASLLENPEGASIMIHLKEDPYTPSEEKGHSGGLRLAAGNITNQMLN